MSSQPTTPFEESDSSLIQRAVRGADDAFETLYNRYRLQLFAYLHKVLATHPEQVDDFFQQTWIKASQNLARYQHQEKFLAWLCRIARNMAMDYFRSHASEGMEELSGDYTSNHLQPDAEVQHNEVVKALKDAVETLPPDQREIVHLREEGMSFKEIAERQQVSLNTALGRMHYAVINLRKLLSEYL